MYIYIGTKCFSKARRHGIDLLRKKNPQLASLGKNVLEYRYMLIPTLRGISLRSAEVIKPTNRPIYSLFHYLLFGS